MLQNRGAMYYYITNLQGDVIRLVNSSGQTAAYYEYDPYGNAIKAAGSHCEINPLRYRGYVYDTETGLYYCQSRYYDPEIGRFINADSFASTGQGIIGYNMFAYCNNNYENFSDSTGTMMIPRDVDMYVGLSVSSTNSTAMQMFYGADLTDNSPNLSDGAMAFVENTTSYNLFGNISVILGKTVVMDNEKYCQFSFAGLGIGISKSIPIDKTVTQGYVYGLEKPSDYCGFFLGGSMNALADTYGGAVASREIYAEITNGMSYAPSVSGSITYYTTPYNEWIYGAADLIQIPNPYQYALVNQSPLM